MLISDAHPDDLACVRHLVITVHGIRTYGNWQERLEELALFRFKDTETESRPHFCHYRYGFFSIVAFYFAPTRWLQIRRFRRDLEHLVSRYPRLERLDIFCHSFGTYLASWALAAKPQIRALPRVANLVLAGSVLRRTHPWLELMGDHVTRVVNECGDRDHVLLLNQLFVPFVGAGGLLGFQTFETRDFVQRYYQIGHSGYFEPRDGDENWFLSRYWLPIICEAGKVSLEPARELLPLTAFRGLRLFLLNSSTVLKISLAGTVIAAAFAYILGLYQNAEEQRRLAVARLAASDALRLARMVNDPTHDMPSAALLAVEALRRLPVNEATEFLQQNALRLAPTMATLRPIETSALSSDESQMAVAWGNTIMLLPTGSSQASRQTPVSLPAGQKILHLRFTVDDKFLVAQSNSGLFVIRLADKQFILSIMDKVATFALSPNGQSLAMVRADGSASMTKLQSDAALPAAIPVSGILSLEYASESLLVALVADAVHVINAGTGEIASKKLNQRAKNIKLDYDRSRVIVFVQNENSPARSDIAVFQLKDGRLEPTGLTRMLVTAVGVGPKGRIIFGDESGIVDTLGAQAGGFKNNCFLHEQQENTQINGRSIEDPQPPVPTRIIISPAEDFALVAAVSRYPDLRLFRFDLSSGRCERIGSITGQVTDTRIIGHGKFVLVRDDRRGLALFDIRIGVTTAQESSGWADTIESGRDHSSLYFTQGALLRSISLDPELARAELCNRLSGRKLTFEQWWVRFGTEPERPTCDVKPVPVR